MSNSEAPSPPAQRVDDFAPIEAYAVLGDGRGVALVADDGRIDWWPVPTIDAPPICAAILDPGCGGYFQLCPDGPGRMTRRYLPDTNVLETEWTTDGGTCRVTEALVTGKAGRLPWTELSRRTTGVSGTVRMRWEFVPGDRFAKAQPWASERNGVPVIMIGDQTVAILLSGAGAAVGEITAGRVSGTFSVSESERVMLSVVASDREPLYLSPSHALEERLDRTIRSWQEWTEGLETDSRWNEYVTRSALALKTLLYEPGGAIAAAATTSLPERVGGPKNWDYRYSWVRDSSFTLDAFIQLGMHEEVQAAVSWLLSALAATAPKLEIFYKLSGGVADSEEDLDVPGYKGSRPVRSGNGAASQIQLGIYGDLFDTIYRYVEAGHLIDSTTADLLTALAQQCCDSWRAKDSGIWELGDLQHYTISKIGCWVALDRAARLADAGELPGRWKERWRDEAEKIRDWVNANCWSEAKNSYTFYAGTDDLDAAVLLAGRTGFERGKRLEGSIAAVKAELCKGPYVYRYSGMQDEEGAFVACTFWLVDALAITGQVADAVELMEEAVGFCNDVGLLAEQIDPGTGAFLGNIPQGLSHLALINAARTLDERASQ